MSLNIVCVLDFLSHFFPERCVPILEGEDVMGYVGHTSVLDAFYVSGTRCAKMGFLRVIRRAPWETQVSANSCCDYPSPGSGPGSGMNCRGASNSRWLMIPVRMLRVLTREFYSFCVLAFNLRSCHLRLTLGCAHLCIHTHTVIGTQRRAQVSSPSTIFEKFEPGT